MRAPIATAAFALVLAAFGPSRANPTTLTASSRSERIPHRHAAYVELLGKGGLWGIGYDVLVAPRVAFGVTASFVVSASERVTTVSPYAAIYPAGGARHRWFVQLGPHIVHLARPSPVPEWPGQHSTGVGAEVSSGYELRTRVLFRAFAMSTVGKGGVSPWLGVSIGLTL